MNFEESAKKLYTLPWQALYDLAVEKQIDGEEIKHKEKTEIIRRVLLSDITEAEIEAVIDDYTYGNRVTFTLWGFSKTLSVEDMYSAHPYVFYQQARILKELRQDHIIGDEYNHLIKSNYDSCLMMINSPSFAQIKNTRTYPSILWIYAPYHQLFAISVILCEINKMNDSVPSPSVALRKMTESGLLDYIVEIAGNCLNMAMETAQDTVAADTGKLFVPQNWIKSKTSLKDIRAAVKQMVASLKMLPDGKKVLARLNEGLAMNKEDFEARWTAD